MKKYKCRKCGREADEIQAGKEKWSIVQKVSDPGEMSVLCDRCLAEKPVVKPAVKKSAAAGKSQKKSQPKK